LLRSSTVPFCSLSDVKKEMQDESNCSDKDRDPEAVLGGF
jgi:hypothetical protein